MKAKRRTPKTGDTKPCLWFDTRTGQAVTALTQLRLNADYFLNSAMKGWCEARTLRSLATNRRSLEMVSAVELGKREAFLAILGLLIDSGSGLRLSVSWEEPAWTRGIMTAPTLRALMNAASLATRQGEDARIVDVLVETRKGELSK